MHDCAVDSDKYGCKQYAEPQTPAKLICHDHLVDKDNLQTSLVGCVTLQKVVNMVCFRFTWQGALLTA